MNLSDVQKRLQAPFPAHLIHWRPSSFSRDRNRVLLLAHIDARAVQDRLDAICPNDWSFELELVPTASRPTVKGRLTVLGVSREDIGEGEGNDLGTLKAAASDALKRCAVHFGIGRYLYDLPKTWAEWDESKRAPVTPPELPQWARPDHERSPGGAHLMQAMEQLRYELPADLELQREIYKHLKAALSSLHPDPTPDRNKGKPEPQQNTAAASDPLGGFPETQEPVSKATLTREGAARLHRDLGPLLAGMNDAEIKAWVGTRLGRLISSFEQVQLDEIAMLKVAARAQLEIQEQRAD